MFSNYKATKQIRNSIYMGCGPTMMSKWLDNGQMFPSLRSAHTKGLVPVTSLCNRSWGLVPSYELAIFD